MVDDVADARCLLHGGYEEVAVQRVAYGAVDRHDALLYVEVQAADGSTLEVVLEALAEPPGHRPIRMGLLRPVGQTTGGTAQTMDQTFYRAKHERRTCL